MSALTKTALDNGGLDLAHVAEVATSTAATSTDRLGQTKRTLAGALAEFPDAYEHAAEAAAQAGLAFVAKSGAEAARDAALIQSGVFKDEETGRAAVADGAAFKVQGSGSVAAYEYRRINSATSILLATYPALNGIIDRVANHRFATVYDVADFTTIVADVTFQISTFRYGRADGSFIAYTANGAFLETPEVNTYIVADCRGAVPILRKGTRSHVWSEVPYLVQDVIILAYKESDIWHSDYVTIQRALEKNARLSTMGEVYDVWQALKITGTWVELTIGEFVYATQSGRLVLHAAPTVLRVPGINGYIVADARGGSIVLSVGKQENVWLENPFLTKDRFVFAHKTNGAWHSNLAPVQKAIDTNPFIRSRITVNSIYDVADLTKVTAGSVFSISTFRYGRDDGTFISYVAGNEVIETPEVNTCILVDCRGSTPAIWKGTRAHVWEEVPYLVPEVFVLAYKESGIWHSNFSNIQRALDRANPPSHSLPEIVAQEKVVRNGGVVGVNCDYTDIKSALDSIKDNSRTKPYVVRVMNGQYDLSDNGFNCLGFKNHVTVAGQSRHGVKVIKRDSVFSSNKAGFDPMYYGESIEYAALRNMTVITKNCKAPVHIDGWALQGLLEVVDCTLLNEEPPTSIHYDLSLAVGLRQGQIVKAINCHGNGQMYAHTSDIKYVGTGCEFHLINCIFTHTDIGDLGTYGLDKWVIKGCKFEYATYVWSDAFGLRNYSQPSIQVEMSGNKVEYVNGMMSVSGQQNDLWEKVFGGKFGVTDSSIHSFNTCVSGSIARNGLVSLASGERQGVIAWQAGQVLYGVSMDEFSAPGDYGVVQYSGTVFLVANAASPIAFGDAVELDSSGKVIKHSNGAIIGFARQSLAAGSGTIKVKLT
ncbi:DUF2190 family protein [Janthinobacterium sp. SUN120]|uniref:DUF2190 family protein n=1 Tax=Janthinobacterium sp. SUN120 TaxID=3004099 RepID=UPI0025AF6BFD|nr:DUF2190 family protein [Janthinobacterium sp. SUN120]MDN2716094.1 DUF2190 family protein [Janthinobacterium sp. SUN120]